jgi:hypothetical protein
LQAEDILVPLLVAGNVLLGAEEFAAVDSDGLKLALKVFLHTARNKPIHLFGPCRVFGHISKNVLLLSHYGRCLERAQDVAN